MSILTGAFRSLKTLAAAGAALLLAHQATAAAPPESFAPLIEKLSPAVVNISTEQKIKGGMEGAPFELPPGEEFDPFREFFDRYGKGGPGGRGGNGGGEQEVFSLGSGFIVDPDGYIVTNNHVIAQADEVEIRLTDDTKLKAKIIGKDSKTDLALLKVDAGKKLPYVSFGDSDAAKVGDWIIAIGNPFGLGGTVTAGIISARARHINAGPFDDFLQTDAAINRGNSGGPMFNVNGEVIGINSAIFSPTGGSVGIGFAVPSNLAKGVITQLREHGRTFRGWLGVKIQTVTEEIADSMGMKEPRGALVMDVTKDSPAGKAGIVSGDVIISFDGKPIKEMRELPRTVAETKIGKSVVVEYLRGGKQLSATVTLGELKEDEQASEEEKSPKSEPKKMSGSEEIMGMTLTGITPEAREEFQLKPSVKGVFVQDIKPNGEAMKRGIQPGDVISKVNEHDIASVKDIKDSLAEAKKAGRKFALARIQRGEEMQFITLPVDTK